MTQSRPLPRHVQISEQLIREIASGLLPDGSRLPPERQLARNLGVAVGTLRKALSLLEDKGLVDRRQGSGTYIRRCADVRSVYAQFRLERPHGGGLPTADILSLSMDELPKSTQAFGLPKRLLRIERLRRLDGIAVARENIWVRADMPPSDPSQISESLYEWYRDALDLLISRVEDKVSVALLPAGTELEGCEVEQAVGHIERRAWDQSGRPAEYSQTWFNPDRARFINRTEAALS